MDNNIENSNEDIKEQKTSKKSTEKKPSVDNVSAKKNVNNTTKKTASSSNSKKTVAKSNSSSTSSKNTSTKKSGTSQNNVTTKKAVATPKAPATKKVIVSEENKQPTKQSTVKAPEKEQAPKKQEQPKETKKVEEVKATVNADNVTNSNTHNNETLISDIVKTDTTASENVEEDISFKQEKNVKKSKKWLIPLIIGLVLIILVGILSTIFAILNIGNTKIIYGTKINDIDISNLSKEEAYEKVNSIITEKLSNPIILKHNEYETNIFAEQFEVAFDLNSAIESAYQKGRDGNLFQNNFDIICSYLSGTNITPTFTYNEDSISTLMTEIETNLPDKLIEPNYYIEGNNLIITKGVNGVVVLRDNLKNNIVNYINNLCYTDSTVDIPCEEKTASAININQIHDEIYKEPKDAYYTTNPYVVYPHSDGIDFSISIDEANQMLTQDAESYTIPLKVLSPNVTTNQIGTEAFPDLLAEYSTTYSTSNRNRSTNISLASSKINGIVIMPGEVFSYNQTVGQRTAAAGFKSAGAYSNGQVVNAIGGGICQVSSTLYNAVLLSNLEIVERTNHYFDPGYVPAGRDATVSWGGPDFRFKNNRDYPIKIICTGTGGRVNFKIYGLHSAGDYEVSIESKYIQTIKYKTVEQKDASLAKGSTKVIESGSNGCKTQTYKILKSNGTVVSRTLISSDTYNPHNRIVAVGTK